MALMCNPEARSAPLTTGCAAVVAVQRMCAPCAASDEDFAADEGVLLHGQKSCAEIGRGHVVEKTPGRKLEAAARMDEHLAGGLLSRNFLDGFEGYGHGEDLPNFGFAEVQRHS